MSIPGCRIVGFATLAILLDGCQTNGNRALWQGSKYTEADRSRAVHRGLEFVYASAKTASNFAAYGHDYLWCFYTIANTAKDPELRRMAREMGRERAQQWRRDNPIVPVNADADTVANLVFGSDGADRLEVPGPALKEQLRRAAGKFNAKDFLLFDPHLEPPPGDIPKICGECGEDNPRGATVCRKCKHTLQMRTKYDIYLDALVTTYTGEVFGVPLGAAHKDVLRWLPTMRPYLSRKQTSYRNFIDTVYAVTHVVYTLNDYGANRIAPGLLPRELSYLRSNMEEAIALEDPETMGEFLDTLKSFGLDESDPLIRSGETYLLSSQNPDGSWGDVKEKDIYSRYHSTWTGVDGLREYQWKREIQVPELKPLLEQ